MRVAAIQMDCIPGDVDENTERACGLVARAGEEGCDLVLLPELADVGYDLSAVSTHAQPLEQHSFLAAIRGVAIKYEVIAVSGICERVNTSVYDSVVATDGRSVLANYRKVHLFSPTGESVVFDAGNEASWFDFHDIRFSLSVCFDLRFPTMYRALALQGADVFLVASAFPFPRQRHWLTLTAARAIENQCYVVAANRVGTDSEITFCGCSEILDPYGTVIASVDEVSPGLAVGVIDSDRLKEVRSAIPIFECESAVVDVVQLDLAVHEGAQSGDTRKEKDSG